MPNCLSTDQPRVGEIIPYFRIYSNMSCSKLYSDCFKSPCLATAGIRCAKLYGLDLIAGRRIPTDGNCMLTFASDQMEMRFLICISKYR